MAAMAQPASARGIDPITMRAIIDIHLADSEDMTRRDKRKHREGEIDDARVALDVYLNDLRAEQAFLEDRDMAQSMALAILRDGNLIHEHFRKEQQLAGDRELALRLARGETVTEEEPPRKRQAKTVDPWQDAEMLHKVSAIYMGVPEDIAMTGTSLESSIPSCPIMLGKDNDDDNDSNIVAESSSWAAGRAPNGESRHRACVACGEQYAFYKLARVPCKHEYCRSCLETLFTLAMKDDSLFPPRCDGQEIPLDQVRFFLPFEVAVKFEAKYAELSTQDRTYCYERKCATFIPRELHEDNVATCPKCQRTTCAACKGPSHSGDCPEDESLQQLLQLADEAQWQRCYQCHRFVDLVHGCNHMSCRCGAQFCYNCGARWKTCRCPESHEDRLRGRAIQLVNRDPHRRLFQPDYIAHEQPLTRAASPAHSLFNGSAFGERRDRSRSPSMSFILSVLANADANESPIPRTQSPVGHLNASTPPNTISAQALQQSSRASTPSLYVPGSPPAEPEANNQPLLAEPAERTTISPNDDQELYIAEAIAHLQQNHDCTHTKWRWIRGPHRCEECHNRLRAYIFECRQCFLQACNTCRRNRL